MKKRIAVVIFLSCHALSAATPSVPLGKFAFTLYREARLPEGNLLMSPFSIHVALSMALAGARGRTAETLRQALELPAGKDPLAGYGAWSAGYASPPGSPYELRVANALWGEKTLALVPAFTERLKTEFHSPFEAVDFIQASGAARDAINRWAEEKTGGKIKDLVGPGAVTPATRLVLANAIYLKAFWEQSFQKEATASESFFADGKKETKTPIMHQTATIPYLETPILQMAELPYREGQLAMVIVLPRRRDGLAALENRLTYDAFKKWLGKMETRSVALAIPSFRFSSEFLLAKALSKLGLKAAFGDEADFTGMAATEKLRISEVIHKTFIDVNETGTEAAAATAVMVKAGAAPMQPKRFTADHPFLFVIYDRRDGGILFVGRLARPT